MVGLNRPLNAENWRFYKIQETRNMQRVADSIFICILIRANLLKTVFSGCLTATCPQVLSSRNPAAPRQHYDYKTKRRTSALVKYNICRRYHHTIYNGLEREVTSFTPKYYLPLIREFVYLSAF
jgi:hypothetical protein